MQISEKIFSILKERNMSQKEFSQKTGIAESTISDWKRKKLNPSAAKLSVICKALEIPLQELLGTETESGGNIVSDGVEYSFILSDREIELIQCFRNMDDAGRDRLLAYMVGLSEKSSSKLQQESHAIIDDQRETPQETELIGKLNVSNSDSIYEPDTDFLIKKQLCRRLRKLSRLDRIRLDESEHSSGLNLHLFKYLDYLGIDKLDYIKKYLSHLQPFMISEIKSQEKFDNAVCVLDEYYRIAVYIKVDATRGEEVIVSFHKNGIARRMPVTRGEGEVYVFAENIGSHVSNTDLYSIYLFITRGATSIPINIAARKYDNDGFMVKKSDITRVLVETANSFLQDLYTADLDFSQIEPFYSLQQISFTSYGTDVFSSISLLVDCLLIQMSTQSKQIADAALCIYCSTVELTQTDKKELLDTLKERFKVNSVKILPEIMSRVELNLGEAE